MIECVDRVIFGADHQFAKWAADRIPGYTPSPGVKALGVLTRTGIGAVVAYENYNGVHIEACIAAEPGSRWASRKTLLHLFGYPFHQLGCHAMSVSVPMSNLPSINLATKLGFTPECIVRFAAHDGSDLVVLKLYRDTCRWIEPDGKKEHERPRAPEPEGNGGSGSPIQPA